MDSQLADSATLLSFEKSSSDKTPSCTEKLLITLF